MLDNVWLDHVWPQTGLIFSVVSNNARQVKIINIAGFPLIRMVASSEFRLDLFYLKHAMMQFRGDTLCEGPAGEGSMCPSDQCLNPTLSQKTIGSDRYLT